MFIARQSEMLREVYREPLRFAQGDSKRSESAQHDRFWPLQYAAKCTDVPYGAI